MDKNKNDRLNRTKPPKSPARQDGRRRAAKYNNSDMEDVTIKAVEGFAGRLAQLRNAKGVSGREMSLSMGQAAGYVNNIENGNNLPSLAMFFEICEYLGVTPQDFFAYTAPAVGEGAALAELLRGLSAEDRELLRRVAERMRGDLK
jgi:transcriptional regulator with XRE-family HTH domain